MKKGKLQRLVTRLGGLSHMGEFSDFVMADETALLCADPGKHTVADLQSEISLRTRSMADSGIQSFGFSDLQRVLEKLSRDQIIHNYVLKKGGETGIIYLDEDDENVVGAVLINDGTTQ